MICHSEGGTGSEFGRWRLDLPRVTIHQRVRAVTSNGGELDATNELRAKLGLPSAPVVMNGLQQVVTFFRAELHVEASEWVDYLRGIDFHKPVETRTLPAGTRLSQHESTGSKREKPFTYFTQPGTSPTSTGTTFPHARYRLYVTARPVVVLISYASSISFNDISKGYMDPVSRMGGGKQLIMASGSADMLLSIEP